MFVLRLQRYLVNCQQWKVKLNSIKFYKSCYCFVSYQFEHIGYCLGTMSLIKFCLINNCSVDYLQFYFGNNSNLVFAELIHQHGNLVLKFFLWYFNLTYTYRSTYCSNFSSFCFSGHCSFFLCFNSIIIYMFTISSFNISYIFAVFSKITITLPNNLTFSISSFSLDWKTFLALWKWT